MPSNAKAFAHASFRSYRPTRNAFLLSPHFRYKEGRRCDPSRSSTNALSNHHRFPPFELVPLKPVSSPLVLEPAPCPTVLPTHAELPNPCSLDMHQQTRA